MAKPLRLALLAGASALGAALITAQPAAAQFALPWGIWAGPPSMMQDEDDLVEDRILPPRVISRIVAAQGYRMATAPRLAGDNVIAIGQNTQGERVRFVIDGYSGRLLRRTALGGQDTFAVRQAPDALGPQSRLDGEPAAKPKPKRKPAPQTAARKPAPDAAPKVQTPAPSQAVKTPAAPTPEAPKAVESPKETAAAPPPAPEKPPLAPDAAPAPKPEAAPATPAPQQAAVPVTPAPVEKPPLTPETKAPEAKPAPETPSAKPADIGPRVQSVAPQAKAPEAAAVEAKPAEPAAEKPAQ